MFERIYRILVKEFLQVFRDPRALGVIFVIPCIQVVVIGYAVNMDVRHVALLVLDQDNSLDSRNLVARFAGSNYFDVVGNASSDADVEEWIDHGRATAVLHLNPGFAEDLRAGRTAQVQMIVDGSDSNTAGIVLGYANKITGAMSQQVLIGRLERTGMIQNPGGVDLDTRAWFNENLDSRNFFVPAVLVIVVTLVTLLLTSMAVVREKEIGTMEQIMVSPITPGELILGKTIPFALIGLLDVLVVTAIGVFWFEVPIRGSLWLLLGSTCIYLMTTLGVGLFISTVSQTQQQAMMTTFFFFFPAMLLSGFTFPIANMPQPAQWITLVDPLRYFLVIVRAIFLKGVGVSVLWPQMAVLAAMGVTILWLAIRRFHKTLA
jgi:ABC-2 type transport system permease protein